MTFTYDISPMCHLIARNDGITFKEKTGSGNLGCREKDSYFKMTASGFGGTW